MNLVSTICRYIPYLSDLAYRCAGTNRRHLQLNYRIPVSNPLQSLKVASIDQRGSKSNALHTQRNP
jgi:hypothetical protein